MVKTYKSSHDNIEKIMEVIAADTPSYFQNYFYTLKIEFTKIFMNIL